MAAALPSLEDFAAQLDSAFVAVDDPGLALVLREAVPSRHAPADTLPAGFVLLFKSADQQVREQRIHTLRHATLGTFAIFLVPVARDADGVSYEAVFN